MGIWHKKKMKRLLVEEDGMTLVEILASILILSLIITTFMSFFIQAAKTNNQTDTVNEATFIAQEQIELLTYYSTTKSVDETMTLIKDASTKAGFTIVSKISKESENLYKGNVEISESKGGKIYAQMETRLSFKTAEKNKN